jgi:3-oxoacyl-[acyl-carrier protein] reductase
MGLKIESQPLRGKTAVITGTSRGIGAEIAVALASAGADIIGNHVDPKKEVRQGETAQRIQPLGVRFDSVLADISTPEGRQALVAGAIGSEGKKIDYLILNAAGGLERDKPEDWATTINVDSQHALVDAFRDHMNPGGVDVFLTSLWAHGYGKYVQLPAYGPVASTKYQFEQEFRGRIPELRESGISIGVIVGHVIKGTAAHTLFSRNAKERLSRLEKMTETGQFPEAADMGVAVRDLLTSPFDSGKTIYVGGTRAELIDKPDGPLSREQVHQRLPMYSRGKLLVDEFELLENGRGKGIRTVRRIDTHGHFTGRFGDINLWRGVDQIEALAQTAGLTVSLTEGDTGALGVFRGVRGGVRFLGMMFPGNRAELHTTVLRRTKEGVIADGEIRMGEDVLTEAKGIDLAIIPDEKIARRLVESQRSQRKG